MPRPATRRFDTDDLFADLQKLRRGEGRASFANDKIPVQLKRRIIDRHLELSSESELPTAKEGSRAPAPVQDTSRDAGAPATTCTAVGFWQPSYVGAITPINWASGTFTTSGPVVVASTAISGLTSGIASGNDPLLQIMGWSNYNPFMSFTLLKQAGDFSLLLPPGAVWTPCGFAPAASLRLVSEVGSEANVPTEEDMREMESGDFLDSVYARVASGRIPAAMDAVIDHVDRLLNDGLFRVCDKLLAQVNLERMPSNVRRAFLAVTRPAKQELSTRAAFYDEALRLLSRERGEETARKMLKSLA